LANEKGGMVRNSRRIRILSAILYISFILFVLRGIALGDPAEDVTAASIPQANEGATQFIFLAIVLLLLVGGGIFWYILILQRRFLRACETQKQLSLYSQSPAGLPAGTIRSLITIFIVMISFYVIVLLLFGFPGSATRYPEVLGAVLTTVIAFYFGSRTASQRTESSAQVVEMEHQQQQIVDQLDSNKTEVLLKKLNKGVGLFEKVMTVLPPETKTAYKEPLSKLKQGAKIVESLVQGKNVSEAISEAQKSFDLFVKKNPLRGIVEKAVQSFGNISGVSLEPLGIISSIVGISTSLVGGVYDKWKARILNLPFAPARIPLKIVDADTGFALLRQNPTFSKVFESEQQEMDRPFMQNLAQDFLQLDSDQLWEKYKKFRKARADLELRSEINPELLAEVGGYERFSDALDKIYDDQKARADLDMIMAVIEELIGKQEPVKSIFDKIRKEVSQ
jgi:hypothetical protein